jgi:hypothetical protein
MDKEISDLRADNIRLKTIEETEESPFHIKPKNKPTADMGKVNGG